MDAPGKDGNESMPEQIKRPNPSRKNKNKNKNKKMMIMMTILALCFINILIF